MTDIDPGPIGEVHVARALDRLQEYYDLPIETIVGHGLLDEEIENRRQVHPQVAKAARTKRSTLGKLHAAAMEAWTLHGQFLPTHVANFFNGGRPARSTLDLLFEGFPEGDEEAADRIDEFVARAVAIGFHGRDGKRNLSGAALLASVLLSSLHPMRFVDYRQTRWANFGRDLGLDLAGCQDWTHGQHIVWSGRVAQGVHDTATVQRYWPSKDDLWSVAVLCWALEYMRDPKNRVKWSKCSDRDALGAFPEGWRKQRLHTYHERSSGLVKEAKKRWCREDPLLRCQVCGFSFVEAYGEAGDGFIEAHHAMPISQLTGRAEHVVEDLEPVCANCHRLIHRGKKTLTMREARRVVRVRFPIGTGNQENV